MIDIMAGFAKSIRTYPMHLEQVGEEAFEVLPYVFMNCFGNCGDWEVLGEQHKIFAYSPLVEMGQLKPLGQGAITSQNLLRLAYRKLYEEFVELRGAVPEDSCASEQIQRAALIAAAVHRSQSDKLGLPYIDHPRRVYINAMLTLAQADLSQEEIDTGLQVALLHDVVEDSGAFHYQQVTFEDLTGWGFSQRVVETVELLTRSNEDDSAYYVNIKADPIARAVKLADIADNLREWRFALLPTDQQIKLKKKYDLALQKLGATLDDLPNETEPMCEFIWWDEFANTDTKMLLEHFTSPSDLLADLLGPEGFTPQSFLNLYDEAFSLTYKWSDSASSEFFKLNCVHNNHRNFSGDQVALAYLWTLSREHNSGKGSELRWKLASALGDPHSFIFSIFRDSIKAYHLNALHESIRRLLDRAGAYTDPRSLQQPEELDNLKENFDRELGGASPALLEIILFWYVQPDKRVSRVFDVLVQSALEKFGRPYGWGMEDDDF